MIVDLTYFQKEPLYLPNISTTGINDNEKYQTFIDKYEFQFLLTALGFDLAKELLEQFETNGDFKPTAAQKWKDLVDGKDNWRGLRFVQSTHKFSMIANYIYCQYLYDTDIKLTTTGSVTSDIEKGNRVTNWYKVVDAWRDMMKQYQIERERLSYFKFPIDNGTKTLEEYLSDNASDFPNYKFQRLQNINSFDI